MAIVTFSTSASNTGSGTTSWTYTNSNWSDKLDIIPPYANISKCTLSVQGKGSVSSVSNHKIYVYIGNTQIASNTDVDTSYESIVNMDIVSYVKNNSSDAGNLIGDLKIEANRGTLRETSIKVDITWEYTLPTYIVTLDANGGSVSPTTVSFTAGSYYGTLPTPTREGYTFNYWMLADGTRIYSNKEPVVTYDHTLYANWTINNYTFTLLMSPEEAGWTPGLTPWSYEYGTKLNVIAIPNEGYRFVRWNDNAESELIDWAGRTGYKRVITITGDVTYIAYFEREEINKVYCGTKKVSVYCGIKKVSVYCGTQKLT